MAATSSLKRDILSAYLVTAARVAAWIIVTGVIVRAAGKTAFAILGLVQSSVGILEYAAIGLAPAIIRLTAQALRGETPRGSIPFASAIDPHSNGNSAGNGDSNLLPYAPADSFVTPAIRDVYANGFAVAVLTAAAGGFCLAIFMSFFNQFMHLFNITVVNAANNRAAFQLILLVGIATLIRMMSDAPGAVLQTRGKIFLDNLYMTAQELVWAIGTTILLLVGKVPWQLATGLSLVAGSILLLILRFVSSHRVGGGLFAKWWLHIRADTIRQLLIFGGMVVAAQAADYLYAPTNNLLIGSFINVEAIADYGPAVQIDGGLLLLSSALASVLLPRTALAHAAGQGRLVRRYYVRGTLAALGILLIAAPIVWLASPLIFQLWFGNSMPITRSILPLILIHTVVGGSSAVARSILLAIGKVRPFTLSVLISGICNVILGYIFVRYTSWGMKGIVFGTIIAVTCRCAIWLPWYTLRTLREAHPREDAPIVQAFGPPPPIV